MVATTEPVTTGGMNFRILPQPGHAQQDFQDSPTNTAPHMAGKPYMAVTGPMAESTEAEGPWTMGSLLPTVVWIRVATPMARKQVLIMTGSTDWGSPARVTNMPAQMKGVKSTRVTCQA